MDGLPILNDDEFPGESLLDSDWCRSWLNQRSSILETGIHIQWKEPEPFPYMVVGPDEDY
jgi:hypothetical protein